ncbi:MAG TPA: dihydroxyacetone kinase phosphoryl donor subunit DhaM [Pilimelia sp.]|nr:dihydroxyacetone kinase phosphoryl donor subunit DhaM [Pilimelia sp.]
MTTMVGIVLISHSSGLAEGAAQLAEQVGRGARVVPAGGTDDGRLGTSTERIAAAIDAADAGAGVLLIPDLGSSVLSARSVLADLDPEDGGVQIRLADAPFVEGAIAAAVAASGGLDLATVATAAEEARDARKL